MLYHQIRTLTLFSSEGCHLHFDSAASWFDSWYNYMTSKVLWAFEVKDKEWYQIYSTTVTGSHDLGHLWPFRVTVFWTCCLSTENLIHYAVEDATLLPEVCSVAGLTQTHNRTGHTCSVCLWGFLWYQEEVRKLHNKVWGFLWLFLCLLQCIELDKFMMVWVVFH